MKTAKYLEQWSNMCSINLRPRTIDSYKRTIRLHIAPFIGDIPLKRLSPEHIVPMLSRLQAAGKHRTAQLTFVILSSALSDAADQDLIKRNPMRTIRKPSHTPQMRRFLSDQELRIYTSVAFADPDRIAWMLGLLCGLRRGEISGLRWCDIDLDANVLHIRSQRVRINGVGLRDTPPKSASGVRTLPIPDILVPLLHQQKQLSGYVVNLSPEALDRRHKMLCIKCGLPGLTLHGLRHTLASQGVRNGIHIKVLQCILGHADYSTTANIYTHVSQSSLSEAASLLSASIACG